MKTKNFSLVIVLILIACFGFIISCTKTDLIAKAANTSFAALVDALSNRISLTDMEGPWRITSPEGDDFYFPEGFSFEFDAAPFLDAGLVPDRLPKSGFPAYSVENDRLIVRFESLGGVFSAEDRESPKKAFEALVKNSRKRIGYHAELDHYGIDLGGGAMFEWAKDLDTNDKDIVFILNPEPFLNAGIEPSSLRGWIFGEVTMMDGRGRKVKVEKLLKPFDLR